MCGNVRIVDVDTDNHCWQNTKLDPQQQGEREGGGIIESSRQLLRMETLCGQDALCLPRVLTDVGHKITIGE